MNAHTIKCLVVSTLMVTFLFVSGCTSAPTLTRYGYQPTTQWDGAKCQDYDKRWRTTGTRTKRKASVNCRAYTDPQSIRRIMDSYGTRTYGHGRMN